MHDFLLYYYLGLIYFYTLNIPSFRNGQNLKKLKWVALNIENKLKVCKMVK